MVRKNILNKIYNIFLSLFVYIDEENDYRELRNNQKLSLRKKAVYSKIMEHRKINSQINKINYIEVKNLDLSNYKDEIEQLISLQSGDDKLLYMTTYLENNIEINDIFSNLFYSNYNTINDLAKYYLMNILAILDKKIMKEFFPNSAIKKNNIIISKDSPLQMSKKFFQILFSILFSVKEKEVQFTIIELLFNYSDSSYDFISYCLGDTRYISKIFNLSFVSNNEVIIDSLIILDNIIINNECLPETLEKILQTDAIILRLKELLKIDNTDIKLNDLELLYTIISKIDNSFFEDYFIDFMNIFYNQITLCKLNEEIIMIILKIISKLTYDNNICNKVVESGLAKHFLDLLDKQDLQKEFLIRIMIIFGNLFGSDEIINYFINNFSSIINIFIKIINSYMFTTNENDIILIKEIIFCLSNFAAGPPEAQIIIAKSDIPNLVMKLMKIKPNNSIYFEGIHFFNNILSNSNKETFAIISELKPFKLFSKGLECTGKIDNLDLCLKAIINLISRNKEVYHTIENLKNEYYSCLTKRKIDELTFHKNKEISQKADEIKYIIEDKMNTD